MPYSLIFSQELPFELTNGNDGRNKRWFNPAKIRNQFEADLKRLRLTRTPFAFPVHVRVTRLLGENQKLWDESSVGRGNYKELEDALVVCGWFVDDNPKWIREVRWRQISQTVTKRKTPGILIEVFTKA
ncbi:MAG: hypothetical protein V4719_00920 [Planctomycetota bacterium]